MFLTAAFFRLAGRAEMTIRMRMARMLVIDTAAKAGANK